MSVSGWGQLLLLAEHCSQKGRGMMVTVQMQELLGGNQSYWSCLAIVGPSAELALQRREVGGISSLPRDTVCSSL